MPGTRKLGKATDARMAMLRQQVTDLLDLGRMETTVTRAKEIAPMAEKMITLGKAKDLASYRQALALITGEDVAKKVFDEITPSIYPQTERDVRDLVTGNAYSPFQNYDYGGLYNVANGVMLISDMATEYGFCSWGGWIWEPLEFARWTPSDEDRIAYPWTNYLKGISKMTLTID